MCVFVLLLALRLSVAGQNENEQVAAIVASLRSREFDRALELLQPALQQCPKNPQLWMLQGLALSGKGDKKSALTSYLSALKISPDYLPALEGAAQIQYERGDPGAVPLLQHILRLEPKESTSHAMLAVLSYKKGECASAWSTLGRAAPS